MPARGLACLLSCFLLLALGVPVRAQDKTLPPGPEKVEKTEKKDGPSAKYERDGTTQFVAWTLAAVGVIIVMILVCMPVRRE